MASCASEEREGSVRETVDQSYLESERFKTFQEQTRREQQQSQVQQGRFVEIIEKKLNKEGSKILPLPAVIDEPYIQAVLKRGQNTPPSILTIFGGRQRYYPLARMNAENAAYYTFMLCKIASYDNCLIWFVTKKNNKIADFETIAAYNQSISYEEISRIMVNESLVRIETVKRVKNPFEQVNTIKQQYKILPSGDIHQINN